MREELDALKQRQQRQNDAIRKYEVFPKYLSHVIAKSPEFNEVPEILSRFATLSSTNKACIAGQL